MFANFWPYPPKSYDSAAHLITLSKALPIEASKPSTALHSIAFLPSLNEGNWLQPKLTTSTIGPLHIEIRRHERTRVSNVHQAKKLYCRWLCISIMLKAVHSLQSTVCFILMQYTLCILCWDVLSSMNSIDNTLPWCNVFFCCTLVHFTLVQALHNNKWASQTVILRWVYCILVNCTLNTVRCSSLFPINR